MSLGGTGINNSFAYNLKLDYESGEEKIFSLFYLQEFLVDLLGNSFDKQSLGCEFTKQLAKNLSFNIGVSFSMYNDQSTPEGFKNSVLEVNPQLSYDLGRDFSLDIGYNGFYNKWGHAGQQSD